MGTNDAPNVCGAKLRGKEATCKRKPAKGRKRCRLHGGASPVGIAAGNWKGGRYSRYLPSGLRRRYLDFISDPKVLELHDEIGLISANITDLVTQADKLRGPELFPNLKAIVDKSLNAYQSNDLHELQKNLWDLKRAVDHGKSVADLWDKIADRVETRRRLVDTQRKHDLDMSRTLTVAEAYSMIAGIANLIREVHHRHLDEKVSRAILLDVNSGFEQNFLRPLEVGAPPGAL